MLLLAPAAAENLPCGPSFDSRWSSADSRLTPTSSIPRACLARSDKGIEDIGCVVCRVFSAFYFKVFHRRYISLVVGRERRILTPAKSLSFLCQDIKSPAAKTCSGQSSRFRHAPIFSVMFDVYQRLLGHMDLDTREWFDGVLTAAARKVVKEPPEVC